MALFIAVLIAGYLVNHSLAGAGLPRDGRKAWLAADLADDMVQLVQAGVVLGWLACIEKRWDWLASWRRGPLLVASMLGTGPVYSVISDQKGMAFSLSVSRFSVQAWSVLGVVAIAALGIAAWQVRLACTQLSRPDFFAYASSRSVVIAALALVSAAVAAQFAEGRAIRELHVHHFMIAWVFASLCSFNTRLSGIAFAVSCGIFVQGLGAYGFAPLTEPAGCFSLELPSLTAESIARSAGCAWDARLVGNIVRLRVCPADQAALAQSQTMHCGGH